MNGTNKYHARRVEVDGNVFDSQKEAIRYQELRLMVRAGLIRNLRMQVPFVLIRAQKDENGKLLERAVTYKADFMYLTRDGKVVVEDVKSEATKTREYIIKRKLMLYTFGYRIREV
jgi:hypothetical protein